MRKRKYFTQVYTKNLLHDFLVTFLIPICNTIPFIKVMSTINGRNYSQKFRKNLSAECFSKVDVVSNYLYRFSVLPFCRNSHKRTIVIYANYLLSFFRRLYFYAKLKIATTKIAQKINLQIFIERLFSIANYCSIILLFRISY